MNSFDFTALYEAQKELDSLIAKNHNITYSSTRTKRTAALYVEIGEFANATRCFKYWSNKSSEEKSIVLDEYADGLHFFLSLGIDIGNPNKKFIQNDNKTDLASQIVNLYGLISEFAKSYSIDSYLKAFQYFLNISYTLGFTVSEVVNAYEIKLKENYRRQNTNY